MSTHQPLEIGRRAKIGRGVCRVGLVVTGRDNRMLALTARHTLWSTPHSSDVHDEATGELIGSRVDLAAGESKRSALWQCIGAFQIASDFTHDADPDPAPDRVAAFQVLEVRTDPCIAGMAVYRRSDSGERVKAIVVEVGGSMRSHDPVTGKEVVLSGVTEIRFSSTQGSAIQFGDAGTLIVDDADAAVGLVVAGDSEACCVAPLSPFLEHHGLRLWNAHSVVEASEPPLFTRLLSLQQNLYASVEDAGYRSLRAAEEAFYEIGEIFGETINRSWGTRQW